MDFSDQTVPEKQRRSAISLGFIRPKKGSCRIGGLDCWTKRAEIQRDLGYIPGEINFFDDMTGREFLRFMTRYRHLPKNNRQKELLERF